MPDDQPFQMLPTMGGHDFDAMVATFARDLVPLRAYPEAPVKSFNWKAELVSNGHWTLFRAQFGANWRIHSASDTERLRILVPHSGGLEVGLGSKTIEARPGTAVLATPSYADHFRIMRGQGDHLGTCLRLDWVVISQQLSRMLERPVSGDIGLTPLLDLSTASGQMHASLLHAIAFGLSNGGPLTRSPIALSLLTESLVRLLLETVPHRFSVTLARKPALVAPWHVKQAKEFMHQNMHRPLKASDIAEACGTGVRSLEAGFRAFQNMALMAYLRRIRLEAVHAELTRPDNLQPVAEIALRWGFAHLGRFSAYYRMAYGELPSETVARKGGHKRC